MPWDHDDRPRDPLVQLGIDMLGKAARRARHRRGWSQRALEDRTGIDQSTISKFENGHRIGMRFSRFTVLVAVLGGLDFDAPGQPPEEPYLGRAAQRRADEAALRASIAAMYWDDFLDEEERLSKDAPPLRPPR